MTALTFYFDAGCPWTWLTSRWLVEATGRAGVPITWRTFSLGLINAGTEIPDEWIPLLEASTLAHRVVESLAEEGRHEDAGAFYTAYGRRRFELDEPLEGLIAAAGADAGIDDAVDRAADTSHDALVQASFETARSVVGADVGSPVVRLDGTERAMFGPIVNPAPKGDDADRLLEALLVLLDVPGVYEVKRSRTGPPDFS